MKRLTLIALVLTIITSLWARTALAIEACELNVEYGDDDDPCVVINDTSLLQNKYKNKYGECTLAKITQAISKDTDGHYCRFSTLDNARVILFQTGEKPDHSVMAKNLKSGSTVDHFTTSSTTMIDQPLTIITTGLFYTLAGALPIWDNDEKNKHDTCLGDPNNDGECKEDSNDATVGDTCTPSCYNYAPTYCQYEQAKGHLNCSSNFNCMQDCQAAYIKSCTAACPAKPNDYGWNDEFVQGKVDGIAGDPINWGTTVEIVDECDYLDPSCSNLFGEGDVWSEKTYFDVTIIEPHKIKSTDYFPEFAEPASKNYRARIQLNKNLTLTGTGTVVLRDIELIGNGGQLIIDGPQVFFERSIFRNIDTGEKLNQLIHVKSGSVIFGNQWGTEGFNGSNIYMFNNTGATPPKAYIRCENADCLGSYSVNGGGTIVQNIDSLIKTQRFEYQPKTAVIIYEPQKSLKCTYFTGSSCTVADPGDDLWFEQPDDQLNSKSSAGGGTIVGDMTDPTVGQMAAKLTKVTKNTPLNVSTIVYDINESKSYTLVPKEKSCGDGEGLVAKYKKWSRTITSFECQKIPTGAKYDKKANSFACPEDYILNAAQDACVTDDTCPDGQQINFGETCENHCGDSKEWNTKFHKCAEMCPAGSHYDLLQTTDYYSTAGCVCDNSELVLKDGSCQACPANMYNIGNSCLCPSNYWQTDDGSVCKPKVACDPTSAKSVNNNCACTYIGATLDAGGTSCSCPAGTVPKKDFTTGFKATCVTTEIVKEQPSVGGDTGNSPAEKAVGGLNDGCAETSDCAESMACENSACVCDTANGYCYDSAVTFQCLKTDACNKDEDGNIPADIGNDTPVSPVQLPVTPSGSSNRGGCMSVSGMTLPQGIAGFLPYLLVLLATRLRRKPH